MTYRLIQSIPDEHQIILIDGSYVRDLSTLAALNPKQITYRQTEGVPFCLAKNWNLAASMVPEKEPYWMFCATDIEFSETSWRRIAALLKNYPDAGIIKDSATNWNVWIVRRWAWDLLAPMDERYKPCGGEDDDLVMKSQMAGVKIKEGMFCVQHAEGGHATRLDIGDKTRGTTWDARRENIALFQKKWGCIPSKGKDATYRAAIQETHFKPRPVRKSPPESFKIPTERVDFPEETPRSWPNPLNVNLGCGIKRKKGFVNVDLQCRSADFLLDIANEEWPWKDGTVDLIESYHVIEHMTEMSGRHMVEKSFKALKSGGRIVIECPDLEQICATYNRTRRKARWGIYGMHKWGENMGHYFGYCGPTLRLLLGQFGFTDIVTGPGTDYHAKLGPCCRAEAVKP